MNNKECARIVRDLIFEIKQLRRQNELLNGKLNIVDNMFRLTRLRDDSSVAYSIDVVPDAEKVAQRLDGEGF